MVSELRGRSVMSACDGCARYCARRKFRRKAASARVRRNKVVPRKHSALPSLQGMMARRDGSVFASGLLQQAAQLALCRLAKTKHCIVREGFYYVESS